MLFGICRSDYHRSCTSEDEYEPIAGPSNHFQRHRYPRKNRRSAANSRIFVGNDWYSGPSETNSSLHSQLPPKCLCNSLFCSKCLNKVDRMKLFVKYALQPILRADNQMFDNIADILELRRQKVWNIFEKLRNTLDSDDGMPYPIPKELVGFKRFPRKFYPLEICFIKRSLLSCEHIPG